MKQKLDLDQKKYLSAIENMVVSPITKRNTRYPIAKELKKMGFLELNKIKDSALISIVLTDSGKEYLADRYEILDQIRYPCKGKYIIYELDNIKGMRTTIGNRNTGEIILETK